MKFTELTVLLPCHSLEDFPVYYEGTQADELLAAWCSLWHPAFLASAAALPAWHRIDVPPETFSGRLMTVAPSCADTVLIPRGIAKRLGLRPIRNTIAILASGEQRAAISYMGVLEIPAIGYRDEIEMTAMSDGGESNHILLGKNFLREFLVTIDCANDVVHFQRTDYSYSPPIDDE